MSVGYIVAAEADIGSAREIADGFDLELIGAGAIGDHAATAAALARAANVGLVLSPAAAADPNFSALLRALATQLGTAQLILATGDARSLFPFLPATWPAMSLEQAQQRARALWQQRNPGQGYQAPAPATPTPEPEPAPQPPVIAEEERPAPPPVVEDVLPEAPPAEQETAPPANETPNDSDVGGADELARDAPSDTFGAGSGAATEAEPPPPAPAPAPARVEAPPPQTAEPPPPIRERRDESADGATATGGVQAKRSAPRQQNAASAPADATAFAPKKVRRGTPELVRIVIHQPQDLSAVIKAAKQIDPRTNPAPSGMSIGDVALGSSVGVSLEVRGAACDGAVQRRTWAGEPIDFNFSIEADADVKQIVVLARVFVDDAQIGVLAFTRPVIGADKKAQGDGDKVRLKRHKRVFLSYSSKDRAVVSAIATAYESAGVEHFWDRASLKSGEEWSPRLRREIERADLFHLCWSKAAAASEWVEKEASYALTRRRRSNGKKPDITVQMLDGPPWAKHPETLDSINFDDFVRAAIVGYARGDGSE